MVYDKSQNALPYENDGSDTADKSAAYGSDKGYGKSAAYDAGGAKSEAAETYAGEDAFEIKGLTFSYDGNKNILENLDLKIKKNRVSVLLGANGCGKTTLFNLMSKGIYPDGGSILLEGKDIDELTRKEFARRVAIVHQNNLIPPDIRVRSLVNYGRTPYLNFFQTAGTQSDIEAINRAMEVTHIKEYENRRVSQLSGGQVQRVWIAAALTQQTDILMLDEPTSFLDIRYQIEVLKLIRLLNIQYGITVIMVLHDINQAAAYADEIIGMKDGAVIGCGSAEDMIDTAFLKELYGIKLKVAEFSGKKYVITV